MVSSTILGGFFPWTEIRNVYGEQKNSQNRLRNLEKFQDAYKIQPSIYAHLPRLIITNGCLALLWQMFITEEILSCSKAPRPCVLCYVCRAVNQRVQSSRVHVAERGVNYSRGGGGVLCEWLARGENDTRNWRMPPRNHLLPCSQLASKFLFLHGCAAILVVLLIHQHTWQRHVGPMYRTIERFTEMD